MSALPKSLRLGITAALVALTLTTYAQDGFNEASKLVVDVCRGEAKVVSQKQTAQLVELEVEIAVAGCDGVCTGTLEYALVFTDANGKEVQWQMADDWNWRDAKAPVTLTLQQQALPGAQLQEVRSMKVGRCSCSTQK
jgi:hypothetical protein